MCEVLLVVVMFLTLNNKHPYTFIIYVIDNSIVLV